MVIQNKYIPTDKGWLSDEACKRLCYAIIAQAGYDYNNYKKQRQEVTNFFKSEWGNAVCGYIGIRPEPMLKALKVKNEK